MSLTKRILYRLSSNRPLRVIDEDGRPYLERYFLFRAFGVRCYLHRFVGDDPALGLHDQPWPWALSIILAGWYREHRRDGTRIVRWFNWLNGDRFHRVTLPLTSAQSLQAFEEDIGREQSAKTKSAILTWLNACDLVDQTHPDNSCWSLFVHRDHATKPWGFWKEHDYWLPLSESRLSGRNKATKATWQQFTYDTPEQMGSSEWWKNTAKHPIAKHHPKRLPETLP